MSWMRKEYGLLGGLPQVRRLFFGVWRGLKHAFGLHIWYCGKSINENYSFDTRTSSSGG